MNVANMNARAFLAFLGLKSNDLYGEIPIPEVRRLIIRAKATFNTQAPAFTRHSEIISGSPRANEDGTVSLRPVRVWVGGIDEEYLIRQLHRLGVLVDALAERGATHLMWG